MILNIEINGQLLYVDVIKRKGTKTVRLAWKDHLRLRLTLPWHARLKDSEKLLESARPWITKRLSEKAERVTFTHGATIPILGSNYKLQVITSTHKHVELQDDKLIVHGKEDHIHDLVYQFLKDKLTQFCTESCQKYAVQLGASMPKVRVKNMNTRWGSCSSSGNISFAWRLAFVPAEIVHYVCAHEAAHLLVMNHSPSFWSKVGDIYPTYNHARKWLRTQGKNIHRYG